MSASTPTLAELAEKVGELEKQVAKLRGLVFAFKPKKGSA